MAAWTTQLRRLNIATHRDLGYFVTALVLAYCVSGIALNHVDDWNPDFVIVKQPVQLGRTYQGKELSPEVVDGFGALVGEARYKIFDQPTPTQLKVYYENATLHLHLETGEGTYERITRRPLFFQVNVLHRNSLKSWRWAADVFAALLIVVSATGLFILRGKYGLAGRGKWLIFAGLVPPLVALLVFQTK